MSLKWTELAAWWGAIVSSCVFAWDIYKWKRSGALVKVQATPDRYLMNTEYPEDETFIFVTATNFGNKNTQINQLVGFWYDSLYHRILNHKSKQFQILIPVASPPLPHVLEPGAEWSGGINQAELSYAHKGYLYCGITHALSRKPIVARVKWPR